MTHEEARKLIQLEADQALNAQESSMLSAHLTDCPECRAYAEQIKELESILIPLLKKQWALQPIPLSIAAIHAGRNAKINTILATRTAAIGIVLLAFIFSAWQFALSGQPGPSLLPVRSLPVPTPVTQSTSTRIIDPDCDEMLYIVRTNDTLESIAFQFAIAKEEIIAVNHLKTEIITTNMELRIPTCNFTPTSTVRPTIFSTRYIPATSPLPSTPGPSG